MNKEDIKFQIDQLRKDKIIYGIEAIATDLAMILFVIMVGWLMPNYTVMMTVISLAALVGVGYTIFMGIGNFLRLQKIKKLEKKLKND